MKLSIRNFCIFATHLSHLVQMHYLNFIEFHAFWSVLLLEFTLMLFFNLFFKPSFKSIEGVIRVCPWAIVIALWAQPHIGQLVEQLQLISVVNLVTCK